MQVERTTGVRAALEDIFTHGRLVPVVAKSGYKTLGDIIRKAPFFEFKTVKARMKIRVMKGYEIEGSGEEPETLAKTISNILTNSGKSFQKALTAYKKRPPLYQ